MNGTWRSVISCFHVCKTIAWKETYRISEHMEFFYGCCMRFNAFQVSLMIVNRKENILLLSMSDCFHVFMHFDWWCCSLNIVWYPPNVCCYALAPVCGWGNTILWGFRGKVMRSWGLAPFLLSHYCCLLEADTTSRDWVTPREGGPATCAAPAHISSSHFAIM